MLPSCEIVPAITTERTVRINESAAWTTFHEYSASIILRYIRAFASANVVTASATRLALTAACSDREWSIDRREGAPLSYHPLRPKIRQAHPLFV